MVATTPVGMCPEGAPHVLIYGHYDVQPAEPLDLWESRRLCRRCGKGRFLRGASDDKGQVHCHLAALAAWKEINGGFPCRMTVVIEGEEEVGSANLMEVVEEKKELLKDAEVLLISDTTMFARGGAFDYLWVARAGGDGDCVEGGEDGFAFGDVWRGGGESGACDL